MDKKIRLKISELAELFSTMVTNFNSFGDSWKNIALGRRAFELMNELPDALEGEFESPEAKAQILGQMLEQMDEFMTPRFCIKVRRQMQNLGLKDDDNEARLRELTDYIDPKLPMEDFCKKYGRMLKFDPIERTQLWEEHIESVEFECAKQLEDEHKGMGYCFMYWSTRRAVLAKYGIEWNPPTVMNPGVMFD